MAQGAGITTTGCSVGPKISPTCHDARWIAADFLETIIGLDNGEVARCNHVKPQLTAQIFNKEGIVATGRVNAIKCTTPTVACRFPRPRLSAWLEPSGTCQVGQCDAVSHRIFGRLPVHLRQGTPERAAVAG